MLLKKSMNVLKLGLIHMQKNRYFKHETDRNEMGRQYSIEHLHRGLKEKERVVYSENGNRAMSGKAFLKKIEKVLPTLGVTRVADISYLASSGYPVFQSCRPNVWHHTRMGQNTGAQGKGPSPVQAKISCIMETIEGYSTENRFPDLIRGSYNFLKNHHTIVNPDHFIQASKALATLDEPLMWTHAYSIAHECSVLVPAEMVYFPFMALEYNTASRFISGSNGLASGSTYLEATIHALYEVIERYYTNLYEEGKLHIEALHEEELLNVGLQELINSPTKEFEIQLYSYEIPNIKNMPTIACVLLVDRKAYQGWGTSSTVQISLDRAISEALQSLSTEISGTREDMDKFGKSIPNSDGSTEDPLERPLFKKIQQPKERTLRIHTYQSRVIDYQFDSLQEEYTFIMKWLKKNGFGEVYLANLTRVGIDIPVVKAIIPNMESENNGKQVSMADAALLTQCRFPSIHFEKTRKET